MSDATKLEGTEANAETKVEVKTYKYKLNTEKTSGFGLKNHGPMFTLVNPGPHSRIMFGYRHRAEAIAGHSTREPVR